MPALPSSSLMPLNELFLAMSEISCANFFSALLVLA